MILSNPYIIVPLVTWLVAQLLKFSLRALRGRLDWRNLYVSGGMPSAHTAVVVALATTAAVLTGTGSPIFGITAVLAAIVTYDSLGVRRASGEQATVLNQVLDHLATQRLGWIGPKERLREVLGHQPMEVLAGILLGLAMGLVFNTGHLSGQLSWISQQPTRPELITELTVAIFVLVAGLGGALLVRLRNPRSASLKRVTRAVMIMTVTVGLAGLLLGFASYEHALYLGWRLWSYVLLMILVGWAVVLTKKYRSWLPEQLAHEANRERRSRWLPKRRPKR